MSSPAFTSSVPHNSACETAMQADCHCQCRGSGHQSDLVERAAACGSGADLAALQNDLERVFGGFRQTVRDVSIPARRGRNTPTAAEAGSLRLEVGKGATWLESLLVDEALHAAFIDVARTSLSLSDDARAKRLDFIRGVTDRARGIVGSPVLFTNVIESHVWCSIVAERLGVDAGDGEPTSSFSNICYPRLTAARTPTTLSSVRQAGLAHLSAEIAGASGLKAADRVELLRLVGAATCADLWHHPSAVRVCLQPFVDGSHWPPAKTTKVAVKPDFDQLMKRWSRKKHW